ncbi:MAG TPA: condensation domain-containing protein, partial [Lysobacter sp.]
MIAVQPSPQNPVDYDPFAEGTLARVVPTTEPQREIWLADQLGPDASLAFNESARMHLRGVLDIAALRAALQELMSRHDALRSSFGPDGETMCVLDAVKLQIDERDLCALDNQERTQLVERRLRLAVDTPFSLEHDRLFRAELLRLAPDEHVLILTAHHIVCDGWSWWVLVQELGTLYAKHCGAAAKELPVAESFADYALAQSTDPHPVLAEDERYWLSRFSGEVPVLELPSDRPRPARR